MIFQSETNPCFPKFESIELELEMPVSNENEILFHPKQILMAVSPNLSQCESWSPPCEAVFRHFVMKKVNRSDSISTFMYVGGLINRFQPVSCPRSDSTRPLLFSHPLSGGHRTRLRIRSETNPNDNLMMRRAGLSTAVRRGLFDAWSTDMCRHKVYNAL